MSKLEELDEEFNNFMHRVTEINEIVKKMNSSDKQIQEIGTLEAERYLKDSSKTVVENIDENTVELKFVNDRTLINREALLKDNENKNQATMSQEVFMSQISRDAEQRHKNKLIRREKCETFKKQAALAFRRGEFEKALSCYNKALEQIKDSCLLYNNRALTWINLKMYNRAVEDTETALKLNENSLKAWLLLAKASFMDGNEKAFENAVREAKNRNENHLKFIDDYVENLKKEKELDNDG